jgi:hypothetical protein
MRLLFSMELPKHRNSKYVMVAQINNFELIVLVYIRD